MPIKPHDLPPAPAHPDIEIVEATTAFARHLRVDVVRFRHRLFAGGWSGERVFDVVRRGGAVAILLYDPDRDSLVMVEQFRLAALFAGGSPWQLECVAGLMEPDESAEQVAVRETREEANLDLIGPLLPIQRFMPATGSFDETVDLFCGRVASTGAAGVYGAPEEQEDIRVVVKPVAEVEAMLDRGGIESSHTVICLYWLLRHRDRLRREWLGG
jgi:ADP-ribose pyrophosphatase